MLQIEAHERQKGNVWLYDLISYIKDPRKRINFLGNHLSNKIFVH